MIRTPHTPAAPETGARFSSCRRYRTLLWRRWDAGPAINWIMLNPSTADEALNDPTVERCQRRSRMLGFGGMTVTNLFALRATRPEKLYADSDPIGPGNQAMIRRSAKSADRVVVAWGNHGRLHGQGSRVRALLARAGLEVWALGLTRIGEPAHPLYLPYSVRPRIIR